MLVSLPTTYREENHSGPFRPSQPFLAQTRLVGYLCLHLRKYSRLSLRFLLGMAAMMNFAEAVDFKARASGRQASTWNGLSLGAGWPQFLAEYYGPGPLQGELDLYAPRGVPVGHTGHDGDWVRRTLAAPGSYGDVPDRQASADRLGPGIFTAEGPRIQSLGRRMLSFTELDRLNACVQSVLGSPPPPPPSTSEDVGTARRPLFEGGRPVFQPGFTGAFPAYFGPAFDTPTTPTMYYEGERVEARGSGYDWVLIRDGSNQPGFVGEIILHADGSMAIGADGRMVRWTDYLCPACLCINHRWTPRCYNCNVSQSPFLVTLQQDPSQLPPSNEWWMACVRIWRSSGGFKGVAQPTEQWIRDQTAYYGEGRVAGYCDRDGRVTKLGEDRVPKLARPETTWLGVDLPGTHYDPRYPQSSQYLLPLTMPTYAAWAAAFHPTFPVLGEFTPAGPTSMGRGILSEDEVLKTTDLLGAESSQHFYEPPRYAREVPDARPDLRREYDLPVYFRCLQFRVDRWVNDMAKWANAGVLPTLQELARDRVGWNSRSLPVIDKFTPNPSLPGAVGEGICGPPATDGLMVPPAAARYLEVNHRVAFVRYCRAFQKLNAGVLGQGTVQRRYGDAGDGPPVHDMFGDADQVAFPKAYLGTAAIGQEQFFQAYVLRMPVREFPQLVWEEGGDESQEYYQYIDVTDNGLTPIWPRLLEGYEERYPAAEYFVNHGYLNQHRGGLEVVYLVTDFVLRRFNSWLQYPWTPRDYISHRTSQSQLIARSREGASAQASNRLQSPLGTVPADLRPFLGKVEPLTQPGMVNRGSKLLRDIRREHDPVPAAPASRTALDASGEEVAAAQSTFFHGVSETAGSVAFSRARPAESVWSGAVSEAGTEATEVIMLDDEPVIPSTDTGPRQTDVPLPEWRRLEPTPEEEEDDHPAAYEEDYIPEPAIIDELARSAEAATARIRDGAAAARRWGHAAPAPVAAVPCEAVVPVKAPPPTRLEVAPGIVIEDPWSYVQPPPAKAPPPALPEAVQGYVNVYIRGHHFQVRVPPRQVLAPWGEAPVAVPPHRPLWWNQLLPSDLAGLPADFAREWADYRRVTLRWAATVPPVLDTGALAIQFLYDATGSEIPATAWDNREYIHTEAHTETGFATALRLSECVGYWTDPASQETVLAPDPGTALQSTNTADRYLPDEAHPLRDSLDGAVALREVVLLHLYPDVGHQQDPMVGYVPYEARISAPLREGLPAVTRIERRMSPAGGSIQAILMEGTGTMMIPACRSEEASQWLLQKSVRGIQAQGPHHNTRVWPAAPQRPTGHASWSSGNSWQDREPTDWIIPGYISDGSETAEGVRAMFALCEQVYFVLLTGMGPHATFGTMPDGHIFVYGATATPLRQAQDLWPLAQFGIHPRLLGQAWAVECMRYLARAPNDVQAGIVGIPTAELFLATLGFPGCNREVVCPEIRLLSVELHQVRVPPLNPQQRPAPANLTRLLRQLEVVQKAEAPKSVSGESFMPGPFAMSTSTADFLTRHEWWVQNRGMGLKYLAGLIYLVLPPLMAQCLPKISEGAWEGGVTTFAPWPAPGVVYVPLVQIMAPSDYALTQDLWDELATIVRQVLVDKTLRTYQHPPRSLQRATSMPLMTRVRLRQVAYLSEVKATITLMINETTPFYTRLMEARRLLLSRLRRTLPHRSLPLAPTVHAP